MGTLTYWYNYSSLLKTQEYGRGEKRDYSIVYYRYSVFLLFPKVTKELFMLLRRRQLQLDLVNNSKPSLSTRYNLLAPSSKRISHLFLYNFSKVRWDTRKKKITSVWNMRLLLTTPTNSAALIVVVVAIELEIKKIMPLCNLICRVDSLFFCSFALPYSSSKICCLCISKRLQS